MTDEQRDRLEPWGWVAVMAVSGLNGGDAPDQATTVAKAAEALSKQLRRAGPDRDPDLDGPPLSPAERDGLMMDARHFMELMADLFGSHPDDERYSDTAYRARLVKRKGWKQPKRETDGKRRRREAARRVYRLMAEDALEHDRSPKQSAAVLAVEAETLLPRSKIMLGLQEYRKHAALMLLLDGEDHLSESEDDARARYLLARIAMSEALGERDGPPEIDEGTE